MFKSSSRSFDRYLMNTVSGVHGAIDATCIKFAIFL